MNLELMLRRRIRDLGEQKMGAAIGVGRSQASRIYSGEAGVLIGRIEALLGFCGLRVVEDDGEVVSLPREEYQALLWFALYGVQAKYGRAYPEAA